jgi:acyl transferase domain-containing protein
MSTSTEQVVAALRESLKELDRLRRQNRRLQLVAREPLAIVGMSCRLPGGAASPRAFWDLLEAGADAISSFPADRGWDLQALYEPDPEAAGLGRSYVREGGFLHDVAEFDAEFFKISPREALITDPQQRLLLETAWEAVEDAGIDPMSLRRSRTGVFAGVMSQDYGLGLQAYGEKPGGQASQQPYVLAGATTSVVTGRVAYALGLEGAAVTVDTACSSSLVALHLACQALRAGECSLALAGGVTVLSTPGVFIEFSRQRGLARDGRCKAFADAADGTSLSEGVGVLLLERLSDARRNEHPVLALVRGSAVNQDGASNGITAPNGPSQRRVIRQALASAGLEASAIDAVEAHGTGTALGDPIEAQALLATYGRDRPEGRPLLLGSLKSNMGHTQAAAGVAGVIKMVMAMRNGLLPRTLHVDSPSTKVDWDAGEVRLLTEALPWPRNGEPRRAGVSSFGISGTNAHVILEEAPPQRSRHSAAGSAGAQPESGIDSNLSPAQHEQPAGDGLLEGPGGSGREGAGSEAVRQDTPGAVLELDVSPWILSGRGIGGLRGQAERLWDFVSDEPNPLAADVAASLLGRPVFDGRGVVVGSDREEMLAGLRALAGGASYPGVASGVAPAGGAGGVVFVFPGQGSQWAAMALELAACSAVFARRLHECSEAFAPFLDWSLEDALLGPGGALELERIDFVQPALFAVMVALAGLWEACGVKPAAVVGHSQGEVAAAHVAGGLSLEDAARVIALRSQLLTELVGKGSVVSISESLERVRELIDRWGADIAIAGVNGPRSVAVAGDPEALAELLAECEAAGVRAREVPATVPTHTRRVEVVRDRLLELLAPVEPRSSEVPFYSTVTGGLLDTSELDAGYWYRNLSSTVEFEQATRALLHDGCRTFIEVSPHPVLTMGVQETVDHVLTGEPAPASDGGGEAGLAVAPVPGAGGLAASEHGLTASEHGLTEGHGIEHVTVLGSLRRGEGGARRLLTSLGEAWAHGVEVDWKTLLGGAGAPGLKLPTYAFQREPYWLAPVQGVAGVGGDRQGGAEGELWEAVEGEDLSGLADDLGLEGAAGRTSLELVLPALSAWRRRRREESLTSEWRYHIGWKRLGQSRSALSGSWLVVAPASFEKDGWVASVVEALRAHGAQVARVDLDGEAMLNRGVLGERLRDALLTAQQESVSLTQQSSPPAWAGLEGVLSLLALEETPHQRCDAVPLGLAGTLALAQAFEEIAVQAPVWLATREAVSVERSDQLMSPTQGMVWGLGRVIGLELSKRRGGLVDLPAMLDASTGRSLCCVLGGGVGEEDQLAVRSGGLFARRLLRSPARRSSSGGVWKPSGTVLVTGGTGGLGAHVARWLARAGARHLVLVSRRGSAAEGAMELKSELEGLGADVRVAGCDVSDRRQLAELLESLPAKHPLDTVVHVAGVSGGGALDGLDVERLQATLACKAQAALHLHELTQHMNLSAFVMFSSLAATMGSGLQGDYAAANAFLDALAEHRQARGLQATSVAWGLWAGGGMGQSPVTEEFHRRGILPMEPERAIGALQQALDHNDTCVTVSRIDWDRYAPAYAFARPRPLIEDLQEARDALAAVQARLDAQPGGDAFANRLSGLSERERKRVALELVRTEAAGVLGHRKLDAIDPERAFKELGFDSVTAVEMRKRLQAVTGLRLAATVVFDYPTSVLLAGHLLREAIGAPQSTVAVKPSTARTQELIAIVGMGCRYPGGASSPERLWELIASGADAIAPFPMDREWDVERLYDPDLDKPGTSYVHEGGFVYDAAEFDAGFFGISPREAVTIDPQQRLLLEASWEAFEDAGILPASLRRTQTGVFMGMNSQDYGVRSYGASDASEGYLITGNSASFLSGRVSYVLGLEGPAISVDTACSSALVAIHLACGALRGGECSLALAGGTAVLSTPLAFTEFSRQRGLAPDGRCKSFADAADGTNWGEGVGVVLVERLSDAQRLGHEVLAVVRASAVNQDGASNGLTAPNGPSQQRVIRQALANAGLEPHEVDVVEAHGTGTPLGDPIEAQALIATYGQDRPPERPLWLGSIKSNIGHTQAAGGVAGVIKMTMALRHQLLPKTLHADVPSSQVDWSAGAVSLLAEARPWKRSGEPRRAGISSFGISGTNVHLILEEAPSPNGGRSAGEGDSAGGEHPEGEGDPGGGEHPEGEGDPAGGEHPEGEGDPAGGEHPEAEGRLAGEGHSPNGGRSEGEGQHEGELVAQESHGVVGLPVVTWTLSGRGHEALRAQAERLRRFVEADERLDMADVGFSLAGRTAFEDRAVVIGSGRGEMLEGLTALAAGQAAPNVVECVGERHTGGTAFMFTGQGAQRAGMGRELYGAFPVFKNALDEVCAELDGHLGQPLLEVLFADPGTPTARLLDQTMFTQAALFALEVALFRLLGLWGVRPDYLIGHSIGELSAACVAEALTLKDACKLAAARGRLMGALPGGGAMVAVQASEEEVCETLEGLEQRVAIAAVNGPSSVVISGDEQAVLEMKELWARRDRKTRRLQVSHAFHSPHIEGMLEQLGQVASELSFAEPQIPIVSNLTGESLSVEQLGDPGYWVQHARRTVRFADGVRWLLAQGVESFLEVGPGGVLSAMCMDCASSSHGVQAEAASRSLPEDRAAGAEDGAIAVPVLRDGRPEAGAFVSALGALWVRGVAVDWAAPVAATGARHLRLPTYAFQRKRCWLEGSSMSQRSAGQRPAGGGELLDAADDGFWPAVEREDLAGLLDTLGFDDEQQRSSMGALLPGLSAWRRRSRERSLAHSWRYRLCWKPITAPSAPALSGAWLVVVPATVAEDLWPTALTGLLREQGAQVLSLPYDGDVDSREQLAGRLRDTVQGLPGEVQGVISLLAFQERRDPVHGSVPEGLAGTLALIQALGDAGVRAPLWLVTRGAVSVAPSDALSSPVQAQVWGLAAAAALELPERWGGIVDLPESLEGGAGSLVAGIVAGGHGEDQLAVRGRTAFVRRLERAEGSEDCVEGPWTPPTGTVLITGGTGGLGAHVARWLARAGAEHLLLASRRGPGAPGAVELQAELEGAGAEVTIAACDVADREQLAGLIESLPEQRPLCAVVHTAGVSVTRMIDSVTMSDLDEALSAKAQGAENLDSLTSDLDLSAFVLFSSVAAAFGSGQGPYGAANAYLDALAAQRRARGLVATSVAWGAWDGEGMAAQEGVGEVMRLHGLNYMAPELALQALEGALLRKETLIAVVDISWEAYAAMFASTGSLTPLIEDLPEMQGALADTAGAGARAAGRELQERLRGASAEERRQLLLKLVQAEVSVVMGYSAGETVDTRRAFKDLGFDSLMAIELRRRLTVATGLALPAALVFNHATVAALADYLLERLTEHAVAAIAPAQRELEQLEAAIADSAMDDGERTAVQARLHTLIAQLNDVRRSQQDATVAEEIESASAEEMIDFIDRQLGML